ncbi:transcriptional regulator [Hyperthermus butylicus]|uniref:Transcription regulator, HTH domain n=1 Tax=Hyperthermus butylicus (strain DSM 5456 / JCM 9403 / PLM1-5) TaxID=415426 RepID=A2BJW7_HYPBU|nr:transcriptional regulator [Hyperthermus butylicus]ABM80278.1 putative transcription regulator, HTH domain [Hyperthermus butylicus DSM 5456]
MRRDQVVGIGMLLVSLGVIVFYAIALFKPDLLGKSDLDYTLVKVTVFIAVAAVMGILAWIGYTLATTPPPKPIEEIEKEIEEELKKLEQELKKEEQEKSQP